MLKEITNNEWFKNWFDTTFYHHLYDERNLQEASYFIEKMIENQLIEKNTKVLDLCCGKGRHAIYLNAQGVDTVGVDLSEQSILYAKSFENDSLSFKVGDMRVPHTTEMYDTILNLFTSFGYFEDDQDSLQVLHSCHQMLKKNGTIILDFLNAHHVYSMALKNDIQKFMIDKPPYQFEVEKWLDDRFVYKTIAVLDALNGTLLGKYKEQVRLFKEEDFRNMFEKAGFHILSLYGGYDLRKFNKNSSERFIIYAKKIEQIY